MSRPQERLTVRAWLARRAPVWELPQVSARRAYAGVALLALVGVGTGVSSSVAATCWQFGWISTEHYDQINLWGWYATTWLIIAGWVAVLALAYRATGDDRHGRVNWWTLHTAGERRRIVHTLAALSVPVMAVMGWHAKSIAAGDLSWRLPQTAVVLALIALTAYLSGVGPAQLGLRRTRDRAQAAAAQASYLNAFFALAMTGALASALLRLLAQEDRSVGLWRRIAQSWSYPVPRPSVGGVVHLLAATLSDAIDEEMIVTVALVLALRAARRPTAEILLAACALRVSYHLYDNVHAGGAVIFTIAFIAIYERTGRILPLIAAHALWDTASAVAVWVPHPADAAIGGLNLGFDWVTLAFLAGPLLAYAPYSLRYPPPAPEAATGPSSTGAAGAGRDPAGDEQPA